MWEKIFNIVLVNRPSRVIYHVAPLYPELQVLRTFRENSPQHKEENLLVHTGMVCDEAAKISEKKNLQIEERVVLLFSSLCHDMGKPAVALTQYKYGHEASGAAVSREFLSRIKTPQRLIQKIEKLVLCHMRHLNCPNKRAVRQLKKDLEPATLRELLMLVEADLLGRIPRQFLSMKTVTLFNGC
jgi:tRNA nucleotidyltransferase (CCA-adding enzyme)